MRGNRWLGASCAAVWCLATVQASAAESKSWVVAWWTLGVSTSDADCPQGLNPLMEHVYRRALVEDLGMTETEAEDIVSGKGNKREILINRGRINGQPVNAYTHPMAVPEKKQFFSEGPNAFGFNLDDNAKTGFQDPESGEKGVDNQYARAMGCNLGHRAYPGARSTYWEYVWSVLRDSMPAWLITVTYDNPETGEVTVSFDRALEHVKKDANANARPDVSFRVDSNYRGQNTFKGKLVDDTITLEGDELYLQGDPFLIARMHLKQPRARLILKEDGNLEGVVGGFQPWLDIYYMYAGSGMSGEGMIGFNVPGTYHALRRLADAEPNSEGQNTAISSAYRIEAVPAFVVTTPEDTKPAIRLSSR